MPEEAVTRVIFGVSLSHQAAEYVLSEAKRRGTVCDIVIADLVMRGMESGHRKERPAHVRKQRTK